MDNPKVNQQHEDNICTYGSKTYHPGMPEPVADAFIQLGSIYRANRGRERETEKNISDKSIDSIPSFWLLVLAYSEEVMNRTTKKASDFSKASFVYSSLERECFICCGNILGEKLGKIIGWI